MRPRPGSRSRRACALALPLLVCAACGDGPRVEQFEREATKRLAELKMIANNRAAFEAEHAKLLAERERLLASLRPVEPEALAAAAAAAGATVQERRAEPEAAVVFRVGAPEDARRLVAAAEGRRPLAVEALQCVRTGCTGTLVALSGDPFYREPRPLYTEDPPRPLWPAAARGRWDRARASADEADALRASLGQVAYVRYLAEEVEAFRAGAEVQRRRSSLVIAAAGAALDGGAAQVQAAAWKDPEAPAVRVVARGAGRDLDERLRRLGRVERKGDAFLVKVELPDEAALR